MKWRQNLSWNSASSRRKWFCFDCLGFCFIRMNLRRELRPFVVKVPLTPNFFLSCQKSPFCPDYIGEKIIVVRFFLDFLWILKIQKIRATAVHGRVTRRMGRVGLWRQPGKPFRLERRWESEETADQRPQRDCSEETFTSVPYRCVAVNCRNVVDLSKCIFVHNLFLWRLNNHFMKVQQAKWEPIQATVFQEYALMETVN